MHRKLWMFLSALACLAATSPLQAQVADSAYTVGVLTPGFGLTQGTMSFIDGGIYLFEPSDGRQIFAVYTETVDPLTGESTVTIISSSGAKVTGVGYAQTMSLNLGGNFPLTLLYGFSIGSGQVNLFGGYTSPLLSSGPTIPFPF